MYNKLYNVCKILFFILLALYTSHSFAQKKEVLDEIRQYEDSMKTIAQEAHRRRPESVSLEAYALTNPLTSCGKITEKDGPIALGRCLRIAGSDGLTEVKDILVFLAKVAEAQK